MIMGMLSWLVVGLFAGWLAGTVMRGGGYMASWETSLSENRLTQEHS